MFLSFKMYKLVCILRLPLWRRTDTFKYLTWWKRVGESNYYYSNDPSSSGASMLFTPMLYIPEWETQLSYFDMSLIAQWLGHFKTSKWLTYTPPASIFWSYRLLKSIFHLCCPRSSLGQGKLGPFFFCFYMSDVSLSSAPLTLDVSSSSPAWLLSLYFFLSPLPRNPKCPTSISLPRHWQQGNFIYHADLQIPM